MPEKSKYFMWGTAAFCAVGALLLFYDTLFGSRFLLRVGKQALSALLPVLYGAFMAYLLAPVVNFFEGLLFEKPLRKARAKGRYTSFGVRAGSILLTWLATGAVVYLFFLFLLPELYRSIVQLVGNVETYYNNTIAWIAHLLETNPQVEHWVVGQLDTYYDSLEAWVTKEVLPQATTVMSVVSGSVVRVVEFFFDLLVGVIVSVYFMATKEELAAQARKVTCGLLKAEKASLVFAGTRRVDEIFSGFVRGKLLDSLIIGIICFIGCSLLKFPYTPLVSVIVGVTNVIPFFGPFLGAIPSIFLILLASPIQAVYFALFVLALQQLDGNVIGPLILGDKTGLPSLWVIIFILLGGSFFGVLGMFFGVPVGASLYSLVNFLLRRRLKKKNLPQNTTAYVDGIPHEEMAEEEEKRP